MADTDAELAERLRKLEAAVAGLTPTAVAPAEDKLADRVMVLLAEKAAKQRAAAPSGMIPAAVRVIQTFTNNPPPGTIAHPQEGGLRTLFLTTVWADMKLVPRMYFDPRYRLSRVAQIGVPVVLALFALNYLFFNYMFFVPVVQQVSERVGCVILAVVLYKLLARESARYKQVLEYLAEYGSAG